MGRFISLERIIEQSKETYYDALALSDDGWHEGQHDPNPWWSYWLGTVLAAYREFEERAGMLTSRRGAKTELILAAIERMPGEFSARDLQRVVPDIGLDLVRRILAREREAGRVTCLGMGASARWRRN